MQVITKLLQPILALNTLNTSDFFRHENMTVKIPLNRKQIRPLSSLLFLTLIQPAANANELNNPSNLQNYEVKVYESEPSSTRKNYPKNVIAPKQDQVALSISDITNYAYKQSITQAFTAYYEALDQLEEHYQESVDNVLDQYEYNLKRAKLSNDNKMDVATAKSTAKERIAALKQERDKKRNELRMLYHIT